MRVTASGWSEQNSKTKKDKHSHKMKKILTLIGIALIAINGITLVQAEQRCWTCNGSGTCNACFGTGKKDCNVCFGTGRTKCFNCSGIGYSLGAEFPDGTTASTRVVRVPCP